MLDRMAEWLMQVTTAVPAIFVAEDSPQFILIRAIFALILITVIVYLIAMRPFRSIILRGAQKLRRLFGLSSK
jgi:hypothetical protein